MKKYSIWLLPAVMLACLFRFGSTANAGARISLLYGASALTALLILAGYVCFARRRDGFFVLLFSAVSVVNTGYYMLSISQTLSQALWANRLAYLGSAFLSPIMLLIILKAANFEAPKGLSRFLFGAGALIFLLAASPGILYLYYKEATLITVNGCSTLQKVYGPLHILYGVYLLAYFIAMTTVIVYAALRKKTESVGHVAILSVAVLVNMTVWLIEQAVDLNFEFLAFSYIISELFLLGLHLMMAEQQRMKEQLQQIAPPQEPASPCITDEPETPMISDKYARYLSGVERLTLTENAIYEAYIKRLTTKEIMAAMNITENTLKFHNKNIYHKLGVSSRKELQEIHRQLNSEGAPPDESADISI